MIFDTDQFYFHSLQISHFVCRILALYHAFWEARSSLPQVPLGQPWHDQFMPRGAGERLVSTWARDLLQTNEALLVAFLSAPTAGLCTAPDTYFNMVALAAGYLVGVKFLVLRVAPTRSLLGTSDLLLAKTVANLQRAACGPGHAAHRCALLVQNMVAKWHAREKPKPEPERPQQTYATPPADFGPQMDDPAMDGSSSVPLASPMPQQSPTQDGGLFFDVEFMFLNSMLSDDTAFWDTLAQEQPTW